MILTPETPALIDNRLIALFLQQGIYGRRKVQGVQNRPGGQQLHLPKHLCLDGAIP